MKRILMSGVLLICVLSSSVKTFGGIYESSEILTTDTYVSAPKNLSAQINYMGANEYVNCYIYWNNNEDIRDYVFYYYEVRVDDDIEVKRTTDYAGYEITLKKESRAKTHTVYVRRCYYTLDGQRHEGVSEWASININIEAYHEYSLSTKITKLEEKNYHTTKIYWKKVKEQCQYEVLRSTGKDGDYKSIATLNKTSYTDTDVTAGKKYYYLIVVSINVHGQKLEEFSKEKSIKVKGKPLTPKIKVSTNKKKLKIKWGTISDNSLWIEIYMKNGQREYKKYKMINRTMNIKKSKKKKGITGIQSSIDTLQKGITYRFKARTCAIVNGRLLYSKWSKVKTVKRK